MSRIKPETYGFGAGVRTRDNRSAVWARIVLVAVVLGVLAGVMTGCSDESGTARAMNGYMEACKVPVSSTLTLGNWGNELKLSCPEFKPNTKGKS